MPSAPEPLEKTGGVRLILTDRNDPDCVASWGEWWLRTSFAPFRIPGQAASPLWSVTFSGEQRSMWLGPTAPWGTSRISSTTSLCSKRNRPAWSPAASNLALARAKRRGEAQKDEEIHVYQPGSSELTSALFDDELAYPVVVINVADVCGGKLTLNELNKWGRGWYVDAVCGPD